MALVSRDAFARTELHRAPAEGECRWCGSRKTRMNHATGKVTKLKTYRYWTETAGGSRFDAPGVYCSMSCLRACGCHPH